VLVSDHLSKAGRDASLTTDGLDARLADAEQRSGRTTLLVNPEAAPNDALIAATPETAPSGRGLFEDLRDGLSDGLDAIGGLPAAKKTTRDVRIERETPAGVPEIRMGQSVPTAERPEPARLYRVRPDDSLWAIAERTYGDGQLYAKLAAYNHDRVTSDGGVREGALILLPDKDVLLRYERGDERVVQRGPAPGRDVREREGPRARTYVVKKGETLSEIVAEQLGTSKRWREVVELNDGAIPENGAVRAGQEILLPAR